MLILIINVIVDKILSYSNKYKTRELFGITITNSIKKRLNLQLNIGVAKFKSFCAVCTSTASIGQVNF